MYPAAMVIGKPPNSRMEVYAWGGIKKEDKRSRVFHTFSRKKWSVFLFPLRLNTYIRAEPWIYMRFSKWEPVNNLSSHHLFSEQKIESLLYSDKRAANVIYVHRTRVIKLMQIQATDLTVVFCFEFNLDLPQIIVFLQI